jgi:phosphoserine phosphatase
VILDVDSTLCGVEGIDWLAQRRGKDIAELCAQFTERAMNGELSLESVYGERLSVIQPTLREIAALSQEYRRTLAPGAQTAISRMRVAGVEVVLVSGGIRRAIEPLVLELGLARDDLFAVELRWDAAGDYMGFDTESPLTRQRGKLDLIRGMSLTAPTLAVGDGATDLAMREAVDAFAAYTGFVRRDRVVASSDFQLAGFGELATLVCTV